MSTHQVIPEDSVQAINHSCLTSESCVRSCSYSPRESVTAAETDRSAFAESLKDKCLALDTKLQDIKCHQEEAKVQLNTQMDGLGTLQGTTSKNLDLVEQTQVKLDEQRKTVQGIQEELGQLKGKYGDSESGLRSGSPAEPLGLDRPTMALGLASRILTLVLSGSMIVSAHTLANQAREISKITKQLSGDVSKPPDSMGEESTSPTKPVGWAGLYSDKIDIVNQGDYEVSDRSGYSQTQLSGGEIIRMRHESKASSPKETMSSLGNVTSGNIAFELDISRSSNRYSDYETPRSGYGYTSSSRSSGGDSRDRSSRSQSSQARSRTYDIYSEEQVLWDMVWNSPTRKDTHSSRPHRMSKLSEDDPPTQGSQSAISPICPALTMPFGDLTSDPRLISERKTETSTKSRASRR